MMGMPSINVGRDIECGMSNPRVPKSSSSNDRDDHKPVPEGVYAVDRKYYQLYVSHIEAKAEDNELRARSIKEALKKVGVWDVLATWGKSGHANNPPVHIAWTPGGKGERVGD